MNYRVKCILFDLDGTLVDTGGAGNRALEKALWSIYKVRNAMKGVNPAGKTDPAIIREIFLNCFKRNCTNKEMRAVQKKYLQYLKRECEISDGYRVMKGIPSLLNRLRKEKVLVGLGTGNLEEGARIKLIRSNLNSLLPFGGFGSDSEDRAELLKIGKLKAEQYSGKKLSKRDIFIVGDTERDIWAARTAEFTVIAAATGHTSAKVLKKCKPDFLLPNFEDENKFVEMLCNEND